MQALNTISAMELVSDLEKSSSMLRRPKVYRKRTDPFTLSDEEFCERYRFTKENIRFIVDLLRRDLKLDNRGNGISPELQVLTAINCWGSRELQHDTGDLHGLSQPTVSRICLRVADALAKHSDTYIRMPNTVLEQKKVIQDFYRISKFPSVIGCVGCTDIKLKNNGVGGEERRKNRKKIYSLNIQVTCDANLHIRDIAVRREGVANDSNILNESTLKVKCERGEFIGQLLGDTGYKLEPYIFTPILRPQDQSEANYNEALTATHTTIEHCFGVWKQRFQCLLRGMPIHRSSIRSIIVALAILHNIAIEKQDPVVDIEERIQKSCDFSYNTSEYMECISHPNVFRAFIDRHFT